MPRPRGYAARTGLATETSGAAGDCYVRGPMRLALLLLATTIAAPAHAQDVEAVAAQPSAPSDAPVETVEPPVEAPPAPERTPRVAVVVAGDPDPETVTAAEAVEIALAEETRVTLPSDAALRGALRGEGETGDGLDEVRAERRRLGLGEARDV